MNHSIQSDLLRLGDQLEKAVAFQIASEIVTRRRRKSRSRATIAALSVAAAAALGGTAAVAVSLMSVETVADGMPASTAIFIGTKATCTTDDGVVFSCTLDKSPRDEIGDFTGTKESFNDEKNRIAGGCIGLDKAGLHWRCYAGERAVTEEIIGPDLLGQQLNSPAGG